ncbi:MAG: hypothetical protein KDI32_09725 [Pseudomonadales bacterium]|nr:hypothetical protein [Pseudomonadales bacterium]
MLVIDHEPHSWFLFEHEEKLFLDANCSHSFLGYSFMIELHEDECSKYRQYGRGYLTELAQSIHNSVPILKDSKSIYKGRDVTQHYLGLTQSALQAWKSPNK